STLLSNMEAVRTLSAEELSMANGGYTQDCPGTMNDGFACDVAATNGTMSDTNTANDCAGVGGSARGGGCRGGSDGGGGRWRVLREGYLSLPSLSNGTSSPVSSETTSDFTLFLGT